MTTHIGLVGGGNISETHARAALAIPGVEIAAIYGSNREKIERLAKAHGGTPYTDFAAFLAHKPMELVAIGSPLRPARRARHRCRTRRSARAHRKTHRHHHRARRRADRRVR
jgi:hypothetical protein